MEGMAPREPADAAQKDAARGDFGYRPPVRGGQGAFEGPGVGDLVVATDAGREGELVARWIIAKAGFKNRSGALDFLPDRPGDPGGIFRVEALVGLRSFVQGGRSAGPSRLAGGPERDAGADLQV
jgi:hypothetical protein